MPEVINFNNKAVFLDRDGVLIRDTHLLTSSNQVSILPGVTNALRELATAGWKLIVVSNQPVVARGLVAEADVVELHREICSEIVARGGSKIDAWYYCPHHPNATMAAYRVNCQCRKPRPGLLLRAAHDHFIDLANSYMVGDRITDIIAGARADCRTVLVETGAHQLPPIQTSEPLDTSISPDYTCRDLDDAAQWILEVM